MLARSLQRTEIDRSDTMNMLLNNSNMQLEQVSQFTPNVTYIS